MKFFLFHVIIDKKNNTKEEFFKVDFEFSNKLNYFQTGIFNILNDKKNKLIAEGKKVYNLSVGTPDFKPSKHVMKALSEASLDAENWKYS